ncbi:BGAL7 [Acrasis kona]|uniref:BGAL7 n=1 Tax=Acrasis kona TaxID=1008807 RepID=A0AAW2Z4J1_9EUKA
MDEIRYEDLEEEQYEPASPSSPKLNINTTDQYANPFEWSVSLVFSTTSFFSCVAFATWSFIICGSEDGSAPNVVSCDTSALRSELMTNGVLDVALASCLLVFTLVSAIMEFNSKSSTLSLLVRFVHLVIRYVTCIVIIVFAAIISKTIWSSGSSCYVRYQNLYRVLNLLMHLYWLINIFLITATTYMLTVSFMFEYNKSKKQNRMGSNKIGTMRNK